MVLEDDSDLPGFSLTRLAALMVRQAATANPTLHSVVAHDRIGGGRCTTAPLRHRRQAGGR
jgi:hypothetical protein